MTSQGTKWNISVGTIFEISNRLQGANEALGKNAQRTRHNGHGYYEQEGSPITHQEGG